MAMREPLPEQTRSDSLDSQPTLSPLESVKREFGWQRNLRGWLYFMTTLPRAAALNGWLKLCIACCLGPTSALRSSCGKDFRLT